jgi:hypothetical protein
VFLCSWTAGVADPVLAIRLKLAHVLQVPVAPVFEYIFDPLYRARAFLGVCCDVNITKSLMHQPEVASVHMTGGGETHDAIVWGAKVLSTPHRISKSLARWQSRQMMVRIGATDLVELMTPSSRSNPKQFGHCFQLWIRAFLE